MKNPLKISLEEIEDWEEFQDLVQAFFKALVKREDSLVKVVRAKKTGRGSDGGRDILVEMEMDDGIQAFTRRWVVQCKANGKARRTEKAAVEGVRDLLDVYKADGFLLICKARASAKLTQLLEELEKSDPRGRCYVYWDGPQFCNLLYPLEDIIRVFFPQYHAAVTAMKAKVNTEKLLRG